MATDVGRRGSNSLGGISPAQDACPDMRVDEVRRNRVQLTERRVALRFPAVRPTTIAMRSASVQV